MVDVAVTVGTDVSRRLVVAERRWRRVKQVKFSRLSFMQQCEISVKKCGFLVLPEVELSQTEAGPSIRNLYCPIHEHHLTLLHGTC